MSDNTIRAKVGFFKLFSASCLGTLFGIVVLACLGTWIIASISEANSSSSSKPNSVLKLSFNGNMPEHSNNKSKNFSATNIDDLLKETVGLYDFEKLIDIAIKDDDIKGIYLDIGSPSIGMASMSKIRAKLEAFKESGKFVLAYSENYSQGAYYLASTANKVYIHPDGLIAFKGFVATLSYYQGLMEKLGVKMQIYYAGKFKSATEPFRRSDMSQANRKQVSRFLNGAYDMYLEDIGRSRNIEKKELVDIANNLRIRQGADALKYKMVDGLKYRHEVLAELRDELGIEEKTKIEALSINEYYSINKAKLQRKNGEGKIAVVMAEGRIIDGEGEDGNIGGARYSKLIRKIRKDEQVKAIVLRVNSGGGSALASDLIWKELKEAQAQGIRVVTSMGDVAASGGYYIACGTDKIFAEKNTITGSIGVFSMIPNMRGLYDQVGVTMDTVKTSKYANLFSESTLYYEFTEDEGRILQETTDRIYTSFKEKVKEARGFENLSQVDSIAQGRVWLGLDAKENGLVDEFGGLKEAISDAAGELTAYDVEVFPKVQSFENEMMEMILGTKANQTANINWEGIQTESLKRQLGSHYKLIEALKMVQDMKGVQAQMPYQIQIQ